MKLSAFLAISVPIVAVAQTPALAQENTAGTGNWLKESVASLKPMKAQAKKLTVSTRAKSNHAAQLRLRPFQPNRYLPRESDMRLASQQAQMDNSASASNGDALSGNVTQQYAQGQRATSAYDQYAMSNMLNKAATTIANVQKQIKVVKKNVGNRAPRVVHGQMPMLPEQLTQQAPIHQIIPNPPMPQARAQFPVNMPVAVFPQAPMMNQQQPQNVMQGMPVVEPPNLSLKEQAALERLVEQNRPTAVMDYNGEVYNAGNSGGNMGRAGGLPMGRAGGLPMGLFGGGNAMQGLAQSRTRANVPAARFGSWHDRGQLQDSGFQSYLARRQPVLFDYSRAQMPKKKTAKAGMRPNGPTQARISQASSRVKPLAVATYPSYTTNRGMSY